MLATTACCLDLMTWRKYCLNKLVLITLFGKGGIPHEKTINSTQLPKNKSRKFQIIDAIYKSESGSDVALIC